MNFLKRYRQLGEDIKKIPDIKIAQSIRINTMLIAEKELIARLEKKKVILEKIQFTKSGYWIKKTEVPIGAITEYLLGYYYLQEAAAQTSVDVLAPKQNEVVLDACAAPGGKTTQISELMQNKGVVVAVDLKEKRITALKNNLERMRTENVIVYEDDARFLKKYGVSFDKILLDAPCSGNYVIDKNWFNKRNIDGINKNAKIQRELIRSCASALKEGGRLVYSTCTLEPEENELNIQWAIDNLPVKLEHFECKIGNPGLTNVFGNQLSEEIKKCRRFWPWKTNTQGFFIAKLKKC